MLARIRKAQETEGFTLIELLVVIIIIGILAAIAIPTFLNQRKKGWKSAMKSDISNATIAEESYATDNNGTYTATLSDLTGQGFNQTQDVTIVAAVTGGGTGFTLTATHSKLTGCSIVYSSSTGKSTETGC